VSRWKLAASAALAAALPYEQSRLNRPLIGGCRRSIQ
jgi:hypothetical protein